MANDKIEKTNLEEIELTEEENKGQLRTYEDDILRIAGGRKLQGRRG